MSSRRRRHHHPAAAASSLLSVARGGGQTENVRKNLFATATLAKNDYGTARACCGSFWLSLLRFTFEIGQVGGPKIKLYTFGRFILFEF